MNSNMLCKSVIYYLLVHKRDRKKTNFFIKMSAYKILNSKPAAANGEIPDAVTGLPIRSISQNLNSMVSSADY